MAAGLDLMLNDFVIAAVILHSGDALLILPPVVESIAVAVEVASVPKNPIQHRLQRPHGLA